MKMRLILIFFTVLIISACNENNSSSESTNKETSIPFINFSYSNYYPHDTTSFTEGLLMHNGKLYESTGATRDLPQTKSLFGTVNLETGKIDIKVELDRNKYFGEGIVFLNEQVFQLTYKSRVGFVYDANTFKKIKEFTIPSKEGWGFTSNGTHLIMSDGTNKLTYLDPISLQVTKTLFVTENGQAKEKLNELEYINGFIYANIWMTNIIVKIDLNDGKVVGKLDLTPYAYEAKSIYPGALEMNGIAYDSVNQKILITGKLWPKIYELNVDLKNQKLPSVAKTP
jgi:glutaminyl-peptide cyclotransferase